MDYETGEDFHAGKEANFITEVGLALYDGEKKKLLSSTSLLINQGRTICDKASRLTGITQEMIEKHGVTMEYATSVMNYFASQAQVLMAHNKDFDEYYWNRDLTQYGYTDNAQRHWLDTMTDVNYPEECYDRSLMYISAFHKIINFNEHRALPDVFNMLTIASKYDINEIYQNSISRRVAIIAMTTREQNELVKKAGRFRWYAKDTTDIPAEHLRGWWARTIKEWELPKVLPSLNFPYEVRDLESGAVLTGHIGRV